MSNGIQNDPVQALLAQTSLSNTLFSSTSRYYGLDTATLALPGGKTIVYILRRFVPPPERFQLLQEHTVVQGDRLDNLAGEYLGDPTLFWRLADANRAMRPEELTETVGRVLRITLPEGINGSSL
jgi:nucleoid-associated protein YgaU